MEKNGNHDDLDQGLLQAEALPEASMTASPAVSPSHDEPLLTLPEAAKILRFHEKTVRRMATRNLIPAIRFGHVWRFDAATLRQWLADQMAQSARIPRAWDK